MMLRIAVFIFFLLPGVSALAAIPVNDCELALTLTPEQERLLERFRAARLDDASKVSLHADLSFEDHIRRLKHLSLNPSRFRSTLRRFLAIAPFVFYGDGEVEWSEWDNIEDLRHRIEGETRSQSDIESYVESFRALSPLVKEISTEQGFGTVEEVYNSLGNKVIANVAPVLSKNPIKDYIHKAGSRAAALKRYLREGLQDPPPKDWDHGFAQELLGVRSGDVRVALSRLPDERRSNYSAHWAGLQVADSPVMGVAKATQLIAPQSGDRLIDVGSGTGTAGVLFGLFHPELRVDGYEIVPEKVQEARRAKSDLSLDNVEFHEQDLSEGDFEIPYARFYYFFNPVHSEVLERVFETINRYALTNPVTIIVYGKGGWPFDTVRNSPNFEEIQRSQRDGVHLFENQTAYQQRQEAKNSALESIPLRGLLDLARTRHDFDDIQDLLFSEAQQVAREIEKERRFRPEVYDYPWAGASGPMITSRAEDLARISEKLKLEPGQRLIDVGSGHGVPNIVLGALNPEVEFIGYDISEPKVKGSKKLAEKLGVSNAKFAQADFADPDFEIDSADVYYFFNPSSREAVQSAAQKIIAANKGRKIKIVSYMYPDVVVPFVEMGFGQPVRDDDLPMYVLEMDVPL